MEPLGLVKLPACLLGGAVRCADFRAQFSGIGLSRAEFHVRAGDRGPLGRGAKLAAVST